MPKNSLLLRFVMFIFMNALDLLNAQVCYFVIPVKTFELRLWF